MSQVRWAVSVEWAAGGSGGKEDKMLWNATKRDAAGRAAVVVHRFSEFPNMHGLVASAFAASDQLNALPSAPPKCMNPLTDQSTPQFLGKRQHELQDYFQRMLVTPRVQRNPDLLVFLARNPATSEPDPARQAAAPVASAEPGGRVAPLGGGGYGGAPPPGGAPGMMPPPGGRRWWLRRRAAGRRPGNDAAAWRWLRRSAAAWRWLRRSAAA